MLCLLAYYYLPLGRSLRRLDGSSKFPCKIFRSNKTVCFFTARAPVVGHINATLKGLTTIRAFNVQNILIKQYDRHQNLHSSTSHMNIAALNAFSFYCDVVSLVYIAAIIITALLVPNGKIKFCEF